MLRGFPVEKRSAGLVQFFSFLLSFKLVIGSDDNALHL